jgi:hypothetical protein
MSGACRTAISEFRRECGRPKARDSHDLPTFPYSNALACWNSPNTKEPDITELIVVKAAMVPCALLRCCLMPGSSNSQNTKVDR